MQNEQKSSETTEKSRQGTHGRNRRRQHSWLRFAIIRCACRESWLFCSSSWTGYLFWWIQLHVPWFPAGTPHRKNCPLHLFSYITLQCIFLNYNALSYICVGLRHSITFRFFWQLLTTATTARVSTTGLATILNMALVVTVLKALPGQFVKVILWLFLLNCEKSSKGWLSERLNHQIRQQHSLNLCYEHGVHIKRNTRNVSCRIEILY